MGLKFGKTEVRRVAAVIDGEYDSVEEAAVACLKEMEAVFADRAKFVVVGQLRADKTGDIDPYDARAVRISLGWYSTEGDARHAAESLWSNLGTGETFRVWVLPVFHMSPAEFHKHRKATESVEAKMRQKRDEELRKLYNPVFSGVEKEGTEA